MSLKYNSTMKVKFIVALSIILVSGTSSSTVNDAFLANTKDVVLMEFSDGSLYRGQVGVFPSPDPNLIEILNEGI